MCAALLFQLAGCFRETISGVGDGGDAGSAEDAGLDGGDAGRRDAGAIDAGAVDAGTCLIDGEVFQAGEWRSVESGSCVTCAPAVSATGWTTLPDGGHCETFTPRLPAERGMVPIFAGCQTSGAKSLCEGVDPGSNCGGGDAVWPCVGGFCNDAGPWGHPDVYATGYCEITVNFGGGIQNCGERGEPNVCAEGPCCLDAGADPDFPSGEVGWCCGLPDGGVPPCLTSGQVCSTNSDCCGGLSCTGHDAVAESDAGYGFCR